MFVNAEHDSPLSIALLWVLSFSPCKLNHPSTIFCSSSLALEQIFYAILFSFVSSGNAPFGQNRQATEQPLENMLQIIDPDSFKNKTNCHLNR
jgi:hypothetical protein